MFSQMPRLSSTINALIGAAPSMCTIRYSPYQARFTSPDLSPLFYQPLFLPTTFYQPLFLPTIVQPQTNKRLSFVFVFHVNAPAIVKLGVVARRGSRYVDDIEKGC